MITAKLGEYDIIEDINKQGITILLVKQSAQVVLSIATLWLCHAICS